jgi:hypothetical protein
MFTTKFVEKIRQHILCSATFLKKIVPFEIICKNTVEPDGPQLILWHMWIACWTSKSTDIHSVILLLHCNSDYMNVPECSDVCTLPVFGNIAVTYDTHEMSL